jgi:hypothetical protein
VSDEFLASYLYQLQLNETLNQSEPLSPTLSNKPQSDLFESLEPDNNKFLSMEPIQSPRTRMPNLVSIQAFTGENYWLIAIVIYIKSIEAMADRVGKDEAGRASLYQLIFYNRLKKAAAQ